MRGARDRSPGRAAGSVVAPSRHRLGATVRPRVGGLRADAVRDLLRPGAVRGPVRRRSPGRGGRRPRPRRLDRRCPRRWRSAPRSLSRSASPSGWSRLSDASPRGVARPPPRCSPAPPVAVSTGASPRWPGSPDPARRPGPSRPADPPTPRGPPATCALSYAARVRATRLITHIAVLGAALTAVLVAWPQAAGAHGLVGRAYLPVPTWLFAWAAGAVLVLSFVALARLWSTPRLERSRPRRLFGLPRMLEPLCGAVGVAVFVAVVVCGVSAAARSRPRIWLRPPCSSCSGSPRRCSARSSATSSGLFNPWRAAARAASALARRWPPSRPRAAGAALPRAARALAGGRRDHRLRLARARVRRARASGDARRARGRLRAGAMGRHGAVRDRGAGPSAATRSRSRSTSSRASRRSNGATGRSSAARPLSGLTSLRADARNGGAAVRDDRHDHLRRLSQRAGLALVRALARA